MNAVRYTAGSDGGSDVSAVGYARARVPTAPDLSLELLTLPERGFVLGAALLGLGAEAPAQLVPQVAERCGAALQVLSTLPRERKATKLGQLARDLGAPFPAGVELCHRSWLKPMLEPEPSDLVQTLVVGAPPPLREAAGELLREREAGGSAATPAVHPARDGHRAAPAGVRAGAGPERRRGPGGRRRCWSWIRPGCARRCGGWGRGRWALPWPRPRTRCAPGRWRRWASSRPTCARPPRTPTSSARRDGELDVKSAAGDAAATVEARLEGIGIWSLARLVRTETTEVRRALAMRLPPRLAKRLLPEGGYPS